MSKQTGRFALAALFAAAAGYVTGILTAPKSGKETREDIKDAASKQIREAEKQLKQKHTELNSLIQVASEKVTGTSKTAKEEFEKKLTQAHKAKDKVRVALSGVHDGESSDKDLQNAINDAEKAIENLKKYLRK